MELQFPRPNKPYVAFPLLLSLLASINACTVAKYDLALLETTQRNDVVPSSYDGPVYFVIPNWIKIERCGWGGLTPCLNSTGARLGRGVRNGLWPLHGTPFKLIDSLTIPPDGLACVIRLEQADPKITSSELVSLATLFVLPAYTTRKYVLSYALFRDKREIITYRYDITETALSGLLTWVLAPVVPFSKDIHLGGWAPGPLSGVIEDATTRFIESEAKPSGVFSR